MQKKPEQKTISELGADAYRAGDFKTAQQHFTQAVAAERRRLQRVKTDSAEGRAAADKLASALFNLGSSELGLEHFDQARACLREAITLNKDEQKKVDKYNLRLKKTNLFQMLSEIEVMRTLAEQRVVHYTMLSWYKKNAISLTTAIKATFDIEALKRDLNRISRPFVIISFGCGGAEEIYTLLELLGEELWEKVCYFGIDPAAHAGAAISFAASGYQNIHFLPIDACDSEAVLKGLRGNQADLLILRHPEFAGNSNHAFKTILSSTIPLVSRAPTNFFVSVYHEKELRAVINCLREGGELSCGERLDLAAQRIIPHSRDSDNDGLTEVSPTGAKFRADNIAFALSYRPKPEKRLGLEAKTDAKAGDPKAAPSAAADQPALPASPSVPSQPVASAAPAANDDKASAACYKMRFFAGAAVVATVAVTAAAAWVSNYSPQR